ncbi:MAG TPA: DnaJ domain-containing protein [Cyclobacteriaceae bacterium]
MQDYYQILGISPRATQLEVKRSYRRLAVQFHPDKNHSKESEERFKEISLAYEVLKNSEKRAQYDISLAFAPPNTRPHRDPAYRSGQRAYYAQRVESKSSNELMAEHLPKFRWACWAGLVVCFLAGVDYFLPRSIYTEEIAEINRMYRTGRGGGTIYDHDELITKNGTVIYLNENDLEYFKQSRSIVINQSGLFKKIVSVATPDNIYSVGVAAIYSGLFFIIVILLVASILGVTIRNSIEFPFNLSIVSSILLIIVCYLLIK